MPVIAAQLFAGSLHRAARRGDAARTEHHDSSHIAGAAHLDGEPVTLPSLLTIDIVPRSLRVIVPDSREESEPQRHRDQREMPP